MADRPAAVSYTHLDVYKRQVLDGSVITSARVNYNQMTAAAEVSMTMNSTGAARWEVITEQNIGKQIAIVMDGSVYSYPNVQNKISGGNSQITGRFTQAEMCIRDSHCCCNRRYYALFGNGWEFLLYGY